MAPVILLGVTGVFAWLAWVVRRSVITVVVILIGVVATVAETTPSHEDREKTINYLLDLVSKSDCTFIRNGQSHAGKAAAAHMRKKYEHFKNEIETPEDFIRLAATKSRATGHPYLVKTKDGKEIHCDAWLGKALEECRKADKESK